MINNKIQQIVTFKVDDEYFGIPVLDVREIIFPTNVQPFTTNNETVTGVVMLRGQVINVLDFRSVLKKEPKEPQKKQRIIILSRGEKTIGLLVDEVSQVASVENMEFDEAPKSSNPYVFAICKDVTKNLVIYMLDVDNLSKTMEGDIHAN